jgi:hypothetical protein
VVGTRARIVWWHAEGRMKKDVVVLAGVTCVRVRRGIYGRPIRRRRGGAFWSRKRSTIMVHRGDNGSRAVASWLTCLTEVQT